MTVTALRLAPPATGVVEPGVPIAQNARALSVRAIAGRAGAEAMSAAALLRAGAVGVDPPQRLLRVLTAFLQWGPAGAALAVGSQRHSDRTALIDDDGTVTFADLDERTTRIANALRERGVTDGDGIGILCRNHRSLFYALFAAAKLGARTVLLNTDFAGPQLADVCDREGVALLIHDSEFAAVVGGYSPVRGTVSTGGDTGLTLAGPIDAGATQRPPRPKHTQQIVLLTSGTTGTPKGAPREFGTSLAIPGGYLSKIPLRARRTVLVAVPVFHAWGLLSSVIALALGDTLVLKRKTEPAEAAALLEKHRCDALITVPIVLSRFLASGTVAAHDLSALRVVAVSGSALPVELADRTRAAFGDVLYNLFGSTEVAYATIATPADLAAAPGTVGRPPHGTTVALLDPDGAPVAAGDTGRVFVGSAIAFHGYTGGGSKEQVAGLMATGDVGHFDSSGRLFIDGRDDDMIVSGGENVFPGEVEELLAAHPSISDVAVTGTPDEEFGQRLRAYVVATGDLDADAVRDHVKAHLARYKVPRDVVFLPELPRNPAGKIVKRELPTD